MGGSACIHTRTHMRAHAHGKHTHARTCMMASNTFEDFVFAEVDGGGTNRRTVKNAHTVHATHLPRV
jgi:hypothetical protein